MELSCQDERSDEGIFLKSENSGGGIVGYCEFRLSTDHKSRCTNIWYGDRKLYVERAGDDIRLWVAYGGSVSVTDGTVRANVMRWWYEKENMDIYRVIGNSRMIPWSMAIHSLVHISDGHVLFYCPLTGSMARDAMNNYVERKAARKTFRVSLLVSFDLSDVISRSGRIMRVGSIWPVADRSVVDQLRYCHDKLVWSYGALNTDYFPDSVYSGEYLESLDLLSAVGRQIVEDLQHRNEEHTDEI